MSETTIIPQDLAAGKFRDAMSLFVGRGRRWSCVSVAAASGIARRTVESYRSGQATPSLEKYQSLCAVLGQAFFAATIEHLPFDVSSREPGDDTPQQLLTYSLEFSARLSRMLEDGRIDHVERRDLKSALGDLRERIAALEARLAGGEG